MKKREAIDFKKILSKSGSLARVMKAPTLWSAAYIARVRQFEKHPGAIVFPQQVFGVSGSIWCVKSDVTRNATSLSIIEIENPMLEHSYSKALPFMNHGWFTREDAARAFARSVLKEAMKAIA